MSSMKKKHALLLLEDFDVLRNTLGRCCSNAGFSVVSTGNLYSAISHAKEEHPEVVIFDFNLKIMDDPYVALSVLHELLPKSKLVVLNRDQHEVVGKLRSMGVNEIVGNKDIPTALERILAASAAPVSES